MNLRCSNTNKNHPKFVAVLTKGFNREIQCQDIFLYAAAKLKFWLLLNIGINKGCLSYMDSQHKT